MSYDIDIVIISADYQRNGIGGEGFYAATIRCDGETLLATIAYNDDGETFSDISCRVVDPLVLGSHYRGDAIGAAMIPQLVKYLKQDEECPNCDVPYNADVEDHKDCAQCNRLAPDTMPHGECETCGAAEGEVHPPACADLIEEESKEKNITTRIYTYDVELDVSYDGEDLVSSCFVSKQRGNTLYCSSLALLSDQGTIEGDNWGDVIQIPEQIITKIHEWAEDNGY